MSRDTLWHFRNISWRWGFPANHQETIQQVHTWRHLSGYSSNKQTITSFEKKIKQNLWTEKKPTMMQETNFPQQASNEPNLCKRGGDQVPRAHLGHLFHRTPPHGPPPLLGEFLQSFAPPNFGWPEK